MSKRVVWIIKIEVVYIPLPVEMEGTRRAGLILLWQWVEKEVEDEYTGFDRDSHGDRAGTALFPLAHDAGKETTTPGILYAWFIGHDGSVVRLAYGSK